MKERDEYLEEFMNSPEWPSQDPETQDKLIACFDTGWDSAMDQADEKLRQLEEIKRAWESRADGWTLIGRIGRILEGK